MENKLLPQKSLLFVLLLIANVLCGQNFQLAGIGYSNYAKTQIKDSPTNQEIESQEFSFFAKLPIKFKDQKTVLINTLRYGLIQPTVHRSPLFTETEFRKNLHSISISPMLVHKIGKKWSAIASLTPTLASDFEEKISGDDLLFLGALLASAKLNDKWTLGGGIVYTTQLGDPRFLPALQLRYLHNRHFINMLLPSFLSYLYRIGPKEKLRMGFRLATNGGNFNVDNQDFTALIPNSINKVIQSRANAGAVVQYQLTKTILLEAFGGTSAARKFKLVDADKIAYKYNSSNGGFLNFGIMLTAPSKSSEGNGVDN